ncbi:MAG: hypothetical protein RMY16_29990 [Nostoc sp. DedQUE12b]|nr:hypothetical protein [Nostoc sp. DedQUE12b]MDZ8089752.1 hypothetical protein [Nostoc sp. DedQUE12b]
MTDIGNTQDSRGDRLQKTFFKALVSVLACLALLKPKFLALER